MYKIPILFLLLLVRSLVAVGRGNDDVNRTKLGQPAASVSKNQHPPTRPEEARQRDHIKAGKRSPESEPALPDPVSSPIRATLTDQPNDFFFRRRKLNLRQRS